MTMISKYILTLALYSLIVFYPASIFSTPQTHNWFPKNNKQQSVSSNISKDQALPQIKGHKVGQLNLTNLKSLYKDIDYKLTSVRTGHTDIPPVFIQEIPTGWKNISSIPEKKRLFIKTLLPLIIAANQDIAEERTKALHLLSQKNTKAFSEEDKQWLKQLYKKYKTQNESVLRKRLDIIPLPLALAQSIEESGWGTSFFARQGNALYGQISQTGMRPKDRPNGPKIKQFDNLLQSVKSYMHNLNTHKAYKGFRDLRFQMRTKKQKLDAYKLAAQLLNYSIKKSVYVQNLHSIMRKNKLHDFAESTFQILPENVGSLIEKKYIKKVGF